MRCFVRFERQLTRDRCLAQPWGINTPLQAPLIIPRYFRQNPPARHEGAEGGYPVRLGNLRPNQHQYAWIREQCGFYGPLTRISILSATGPTAFVFFEYLEDVSYSQLNSLSRK